MSTYFAASLLAAQLAGTSVPAPETPPPAVVEVPADWASPNYDPRATRVAIREIVAESTAKEDAASALRFSGGPRRDDKYEKFARKFDFAEVPRCLGPNALKHQPHKIGPIAIGGILALPFLVVAAARGKCN